MTPAKITAIQKTEKFMEWVVRAVLVFMVTQIWQYTKAIEELKVRQEYNSSALINIQATVAVNEFKDNEEHRILRSNINDFNNKLFEFKQSIK